MERIPFEKAILGVYEPCEVGISLGPTWSTHWFCVDLTIPGSMDGKIVYLMFDPSCEALVWSDQGHPLTGITGGNGIDRHIDYLVTKHAKANQKYRFWIEVAANGMFGAGSNTMIGPPDPNRTFVLKTAELVVNDDIAQSVYWDLEVMLGLVQEMPEQSQLGNDALYCANKVINIIIPGNRESLIHANSISKGFFETRKDIGYAGHFVTAIGNCHIDTGSMNSCSMALAL
jgi:alpha-mannosidase